MQKYTKKSAISMLLAVMMVVSLFAGSIPAMAAPTLYPQDMSEIGQITFDVIKASTAPVLDGTVNEAKYGAPIATLNIGTSGSYYSLESYLTAQDAEKVLPKDWNIYVTYDDEYIYVASTVYDESHNTPKGGVDIWEGDYLGVDISTNISGSFADMRNRNRFAIGMSNDGDVCMYLANKQSNITASPYRDGYIFNDSGTVTRDEVTKITTYEMRIPWDCVSPDGKPVPEAYMLLYLGVGHEGFESTQGYGGYLGAFRYAAEVPAAMQVEVGGTVVYHIADFNSVEYPIGTPVTSGLAFNGVNQCIELNSPLSVAEQPTTFETILRTSKHGRQILFGNYNGSGIDINIEIHANNELRYYENGVPSLMTRPATDALFDGEWHTITFVRDVVGRRGTFYIDGELFQEFTNVTYSNASTAMVLNHRIGADQRAGSLYFGGEISEVRLWNTKRTPEQIKTNANVNLTGRESGLAHLYQLSDDAPSSPIVPDMADRTQKINGRLIGFSVEMPAPEYAGLRFNGSGQNASMQKPLGSDIPVTVEMVVMMSGHGKRQILFGGNLNMNVEITASNVLRYWENGSPDLYTPSVPAIYDGQWHTITFVRDYSRGYVAFYVDGHLFHEWTGLSLSNSSNTLPAIQYFGADSRQTMTFDGVLSEMRLWNTVRTSEEIAVNVNKNLTGLESGLAHLYQLNDDLLTSYPAVIRDKASSNPINMSLIGFVDPLEISISAPSKLLDRGELIDVSVTITNKTNADFEGCSIIMSAPYSAIPVSIPSGSGIDIPVGGQVTLDYQYKVVEGGREAFRVRLEKDGEEINSAFAGVSVAGPGFYRGDNHSHSVHSDGGGTIAQNAAQAFNVQLLSWLNSTDHNTMTHLTDTIIQTANYGGRFINLASNEYSFSYGHALTLGTNAVFPASMVRFQGDTEGWQSVIDATNAVGGSFYIAHNYEGGIGHSYDYTVPTLMGLRNHAGLEVWNSLNRTAHDPLSRMQFDAWDMMNAQGTDKYAGITVSDSHSVAKIGDAHIKAYLPSLTTNNINAVLKNGSYIGTNGPEIRFNIDGAGIADSLKVTGAGTANFNVNAYCPVSNLTSVEIIKNTITGEYELNREVAWSVDLRGANTNSFDGTIQLEVKPGEFYRVEVNSEKAAAAMTLTGYAYTNNIWIETASKSNATNLSDIQYSGNDIEIITLPTGIMYMSGSENANLDLDKLTATVAGGVKLEKKYDETTRILTINVTAEDGTVSVKEIFVLDPIAYEPVDHESQTVEDAVASAAVVGGNTLMVAVVEFLSDITTNTISETFTVESNTKGTYTVGTYQVYVALSGNKVTECYIVEETGPVVVAVSSVSNAKFISIKETVKNIWTLSFTADVKYSDGTSKTIQYAVNLSGNNANQDGKYKFNADHDLAGYTLAYDIKGNGSNIKEFKLTK